MSGRIWVVEYTEEPGRKAAWHMLPDAMESRYSARLLQKRVREEAEKTRVVQYVRQGGAR